MYFLSVTWRRARPQKGRGARSLAACGRAMTQGGQARAAAATSALTAAALPPLPRLPATVCQQQRQQLERASTRDIGARPRRCPWRAVGAAVLVHHQRPLRSSRRPRARPPRTCTAPAYPERHASRHMLEGECEARREVNEARDGARYGTWGQGSLRAHPGSMHHLGAAARAKHPQGADAPAAVAG